MSTPSNLFTGVQLNNLDYTPTSTDTVFAFHSYRANAASTLTVTKVIGGASVTSTQDAFVSVTNSTLYNSMALYRIDITDTDEINLAFTGQNAARGSYAVFQLADIDETTAVNLSVTDPNIDGGTGPFEISGTTTATTSATKTVISGCTFIPPSATVDGATAISAGIDDGQITLSCAYEEQASPALFTHGYTLSAASVRSPLLAVAYNTVAPIPDITIDDYGNLSAIQVFQRSTSNNKLITVTGDYNNGTPTNIEARVVDEGTSTPVTGLDWQTLEAGPTGGTYSGTLTVPEGGLYQVQTRWSNDTAKNVSQVQGFGVGIGVNMYGQSNMDRMSFVTDTPPTADAKTTYYETDWVVVPDGNGVREMLNRIVTLTGLPCFAFNSSQGGLSIDELTDPSTGWTELETKLTGVGGDTELMVWTQGEADGQDGTTKAAYKSDFINSIQADLLTLTGRTSSEFTCFISLLGNSNAYASYTDEKLETIRDALRELGDEPGIVMSHTNVDQPLTDTIHMTAAGFGESGKRFAQSIAFANGDVTFSGKGPEITSAELVGDDVILTITQDGGTALAQTSSGDFDVFVVSDDGFSTTETISTYTIDSPTQITLGLSATPSGDVEIRYDWGMDLVLNNIVVDNTSLALPIFPPGTLTTAEASVNVTVPAGALTLTGQTPTVQATNNIDLEIPVGSLNLTGQIPTVVIVAGVLVDIPVGSLTLNTFAPFVDLGDLSLTIPAGVMTITGLIPRVLTVLSEDLNFSVSGVINTDPVLVKGKINTSPVNTVGRIDGS